METGPSLTDGARSFYVFLNDFANVVPVIFALMSLVMCIYTGHNIWKMVQNEGDGIGGQGMAGQIAGFILAALLGISVVVTYALSNIWFFGTAS